MAKRMSRYASMTASQLSQETRERKLTKPEGMINISEWADFLETEDAKAASAADTKPNPVAKVEVNEPENEIDGMTVPELKAYAEEHKIDLGEATKKGDILAVIDKAKGE